MAQELKNPMQYSFASEIKTNLEQMNNQSAEENLDSSNSILFQTQQPQNSMNFTGKNIIHENKTDYIKMPIAQSPVILLASPDFETRMISGNNKSSVERSRKRKEEDMQNRKQVVHVRAKRGQATDSHSLAERVRREKINEKLRCLQELVPGCYKAMGMAAMLDVIISYVLSLQNQIEFLSMKLSAATMYYELQLSEIEAMETMQGTKTDANGQVQEMERMVRAGYGGPFPFN